MHFQSFIIFAVIIILFTLAIEVELKHQYKPVHKSPLSLSKKELEYLRQKTDLRKTKESMSVATHMPHSKPERPTSKELMEDNVKEIFKGEPKPESPSKPNDEPELSEIPKPKLIPESLKPIDEPDSSEIPKQKPIPDFSKIPNPKETNEFSSITNDEPQSESPVISNDQTDLNSIVESTFPNLDDKSNGETQPIDIITELSSTSIIIKMITYFGVPLFCLLLLCCLFNCCLPKCSCSCRSRSKKRKMFIKPKKQKKNNKKKRNYKKSSTSSSSSNSLSQ